MAVEVELRCLECGHAFKAKRATAKFCSTLCRTRAHRGGRSGHPADVVPIGNAFGNAYVEPDLVGGRNVRAITEALEKSGQLDTPLGAQALTLAGVLDKAKDTGSAMASVSRELRIVMAEVRSYGNAQAGTIADRLREQRERRLTAARGA